MAKESILPDTSVLIEGILSKQITAGKLKPAKLFIHEASVAELEHQANESQETGYLGLDEIGRLQVLAAKKFTLQFVGERPGEFDIERAGSGAIDAMIRDSATSNGATLHTADAVQARVAEAKGLPVIFHEMREGDGEMSIESFFDEETMSVHIKENCPIKAKRGKPGTWEFAVVAKKKATRADLERYAHEIVEAAQSRRDGFLEVVRKGSTICQVGRYRIVITRPPFSDLWEITAVRPVKHLSIDDYKMSSKLTKRIGEQAEGILIAGAPGHGKSTFAQALAEFYAKQNKVIKTVEAPRDLILSDEITQYSMSHGSPEEIHDILLLSRPDYTIFDEMRNTDDFKLYADMRLSGVGMIGVIHGTAPIDAIQRFLGRIELGVIPHVVDTVIFIKNGQAEHVYAISMTVKVPSGMQEADLARPVVEVHDFESGKLDYEMYTYGEQTVVMKVDGAASAKAADTGVSKMISRGVKEYFENFTDFVSVTMKGQNRAVVKVPSNVMSEIIGRGGERIKKIEQELGIGIDLEEAEVPEDGGRGGWYDRARKRAPVRKAKHGKKKRR